MKRVNLDKIQVTNPCSTDWETMTGDEKVRFCDACSKQVFNLSAMTRREIESLVKDTGGRFCARVLRDVDGSVITAGASRGLNLIRLRAPTMASAIMTAALGLGQSAVVMPPVRTDLPQLIEARNQSNRDLNNQKTQGGTADIHGTVYDTAGAVIVRAQVTLTDERTKKQFRILSSDVGDFRFISLSAGTYKLEVESLGSVTDKRNINLRTGEGMQIDITLLPGTITQGGIVVGWRDETLDTNSVPESLLNPIKAVQLFVKPLNEKAKSVRKKLSRKP